MTIKETILNFPGLTDFPERYLDVIEDGKKFIGEEIFIIVTSVLQTSAGRMIFAKPKEN